MADITVAPGVAYDTSIDWGTTGLAGTIGIRLLDGNGATSVARATAGIREYPAGSGRYEYTRTAPATQGDYQEFWDDGSVTPGHTGNGDSVRVTYTASAVASGSLYITVEELKKTLALPGTTFVDDDIERALNAACRTIDAYKNTRFYPTSETRYYTADPYATQLDIDDCTAITSLTVDEEGDRSYSTSWVEGTDYDLGPANAALEGAPYKRIVLTDPGTGQRFPRYERAIKIIGSFGWASAPWQVVQATEILARRFVSRRTTPYGILIAGTEAVAAARLGRIDPDVAELLDNLPGEQRPRSVSVKLS